MANTVPGSRRRSFRVITGVLAAVFVLLLALGGLLTVNDLLADPYGQSYYAALGVKLDALKNAGSPKIVVIGGSGTAFGVDAKLVTQETGLPCVNFGLYAAFGLKCMLDLALPCLGNGDIVIVAPEYSSQMFSSYIGYDALYKASGNCRDVMALGSDYSLGMLKQLTLQLGKKAQLSFGSGISVSGVYALSSFDNAGNLTYPRPENIMDGLFSADNLPELCGAVVTDDFTSLVNCFAAAARKQGSCVYFGFCPVNELAVDASPSDTEAFLSALSDGLEFPILSNLRDHILPAGYFYDSNFHMNDTGMLYNTILLINDLRREMGDLSAPSLHLPSAPSGSSSGDVLYSGSDGIFNYDITAAGAVITGLTPDGLAAESLAVPGMLENVAVYKISSKAFSGCNARSIVLPESISVLGGSLFSGCSNLTTVTIPSASLPQVGDSLLVDAPKSLKLLVPAAILGTYITDYFWAPYSGSLDVIS